MSQQIGVSCDRLECLDRLLCLDRLEWLDRSEWLDLMECLYRLKCLDILECLHRLECLEILWYFDISECLDWLDVMYWLVISKYPIYQLGRVRGGWRDFLILQFTGNVGGGWVRGQDQKFKIVCFFKEEWISLKIYWEFWIL